MINSNLVQKKITILCWLVILIGFVSINRLDQYTSWIISFAFYYFCVTLKLPNNKSEDKLLFIYLIYLLFEVIRGAIIADGYWEYKNLVTGTLALSMPTMLLIFKNPTICKSILQKWIKIGLPLYILALILGLDLGASHYYLGFILVWGCFIPIIPSKKYKIIFLVLLSIMLIGAIDNRSQAIKAAFALTLSFLLQFKFFLKKWILKILFLLFFMLPPLLLYYGITGKYNFFEEGLSPIIELFGISEKDSGSAQADTRTFIYVDVINSSIQGDYIILGNSPARGNRSGVYELNIIDSSLDVTKKGERHYNEVCHPNVYTWMGIIGLLLYSLFYLRASFKSIFNGKNIYIQILGCFVAFKWLFGWIEDTNLFNLQNISIWMAIAICSSPQFINMNNKEFKNWFRSIFPYRQYKMKRK